MSTSKFRVLRTCEFCGKEFYAQKVSTRYCSKRCNELAYKQRRRQRQITEAEARVLQKPIEEVGNKEFLSLQDASVLFGITKRSVYNLIYNGVLQAFKFSSRMTFVRKADIERMFEGHIYTKKVKPERKPITEFYTTKEIQEKFGVSEAWVFKLAKEKKIPKVLHHGKTYWSKQHVDKHFAKHIENNNIVEWYSVQDMMEKFNMTTSAVYCFVSKFNIPKKKIKTSVYYSKQHVDAAKGINEPPKEEFYTMKEAVQHFGMTEDQIYKYAKKAKVSKHMEGRIVLMNKRELDAALAPPSI
ncbi:MAG: helix-turn-helix domain-containing protein [Bacteroidaceae bacterium]|nr:helix-turn-helix domain-containing protein [Bacteroidaceae bacterium]MDY4160132.1 helix-turn-helix domain-containing protein [Prevotella sp.]